MEEQVSARVFKSSISSIDKLAERLSYPGARVSRSAAIRILIELGLEVVRANGGALPPRAGK